MATNYEKPTMIDDMTGIVSTKLVVAQMKRSGKFRGNMTTFSVDGNVLSTMDVNTGAGTITLSAIKEKGVQISVPFWPVYEMIKMQLERLNNTEDKGE